MTSEAPPGITIWPRAVVVGIEDIIWGQHIIVDDFVFIGRQQKATIGNYVHIASHASLSGGGELVIADFAGISSGVRLLTGTDDFVGAGLTGPCVPPELRVVRRGRVVLCSHAVVGANAVVLPDVVIGEGAAVGAGAVVTRDLEAWGVYAGVPARRVRERPREPVIAAERLLYERYGTPEPAFRLPALPPE
jgi:galactoside O-acetyltransferase